MSSVADRVGKFVDFCRSKGVPDADIALACFKYIYGGEPHAGRYGDKALDGGPGSGQKGHTTNKTDWSKETNHQGNPATVSHGGKTYHATGKLGKHIKSGTPSAEYSHHSDYGKTGNVESRVWRRHTGEVDQDSAMDAYMATDPPVSEKQRKAMWAAKEGHSTLGIPKSVGEKFVGKGHDSDLTRFPGRDCNKGMDADPAPHVNPEDAKEPKAIPAMKQQGTTRGGTPDRPDVDPTKDKKKAKDAKDASSEAFSGNVAHEVHKGMPQKQAVAVTYAKERAGKEMKADKALNRFPG